MDKIKNIMLLGVVTILTLVLISSASAEVNCVNFEDAEMNPGESIEGIYWNDVLWINATTGNASLVAENDSTFKAYDANKGSSSNEYINGYLTGNGIAQDIRPRTESQIFEFSFNGTIMVNNFSLELFDFGDWNPTRNSEISATLTAYDNDGIEIDSANFTVNLSEFDGTIAEQYDAQYGPETLEVEGSKIAKVTLLINDGGTDPNFAIDNICFDAYNLSTYCLFAGQDIPIGTVDVWHDCENLYVKYMINEEYNDWYFTETHFDIATDVEGIPQNKNYIPIPGQFNYGNDSLNHVKEYLKTIPLSELPSEYCDGLIIAAHANVVELGEFEMMVYSNETNEITWENSTGATGTAVNSWPHPNWVDDSFGENTSWVWESYYVLDPVNTAKVNFTHNFIIPDDAINLAGSIDINGDNAYVLYLNDVYIGEDTASDGYGWKTIENYDMSSALINGENELFIEATNYALSGGTIQSNPAGIIYEAQITYLQEIGDESAWGADCENPLQFDGKNWATYFQYNPNCELCE